MKNFTELSAKDMNETDGGIIVTTAAIVAGVIAATVGAYGFYTGYKSR
ncbi:class IIb bacteriocin, lactobin A/cerein 7B family [Ruminococcus sp.]|jgi:lactobin A/cerein 7B family class IIb bacteriocin|nr:class IIb bacteriocin, lactobin A/cerein 7B family [Ruminococcus sp.]